MPRGLLAQAWFFLLILEAIHPLSDFGGYLYRIIVGRDFFISLNQISCISCFKSDIALP